MKQLYKGVIVLTVLVFLTACAGGYPQRYNTQRGAAIGAGAGALAGQIIGHDTEGTLIGAGVGTLLGAIIGNSIDQQQQAVREAALTNKRIVYHDNRDHAVGAIPGPIDQHTQCRKVTKRVWDKGNLVSEKVEEVCEGEQNSSDY